MCLVGGMDLKRGIKFKILQVKYTYLLIYLFESLEATIHFHRPDLLSSPPSDLIIPLNPPLGFFPSKKTIHIYMY